MDKDQRRMMSIPDTDQAAGQAAAGDALLSVVMPIYNEETCLTEVLGELLPYCRERNYTLILVDDGSQDATPAILQGFSGDSAVRLLRHKVNRGYGGALKTGIRHASTPYVATLDADGQHDPADLERLFQFALAQQADLVVGRRAAGRHANLLRGVGKWLIRRFAALLMPIHIADLNSGFKLYRTDLVQRYLPVCPDSMAFSDVISLIFIKQRHLVLEHPIQVKPRASGRSTITALTAFQTIIEIINISMLFNPLRIFLPLALLCIGFGFAWGIPIMLQDRGVSVGAMLAIVTGLLFFFIGLIAEQLSALRMGLLGREEPGGDPKDGEA